MSNNKFSSDFIIENSKITELSAQKKSFSGTGGIQIPFSLGVGTSHRARGIPYFCTTSNPSSIFTTSKIKSPPVPILYYTFEALNGSNLENQATDGATINSTLADNAELVTTISEPDPDEAPIRGSKCIKFDGANDYLNMNNAASTVQNMETGSITFWVYQTSDGERMYFNAADEGDSGNSKIEFYSDTSQDSIFYRVEEDSVGTILSMSFFDSGGMDGDEWNHLAVTVGTSGTKLYLNGVQVATSATQAFFSDVADLDQIRLGVNEGLNDDYAGYIDEFAIWNVELEPSEVVAIASSSPPDLNAIGPSLPNSYFYD